jgi:class 3 adenylate cyclase/tetratricopeptide (TPR) repeat protein
VSFIAKLQRAREILAQQGRLSTRALERELEIGGDELDELIEELVDVQRVARREGKILVWGGAAAAHASDVAVQRPAEQAEARKVVTVVFADLVGSTALHERVDAESARRLMDRYYRAMSTAVESHGGTVVKLLGDGVMAVFGVPQVAEDDALRAVRAGVAMQQAFRRLVGEQGVVLAEIGLRIAVNTGEVVVSGDNDDVVGDPVNVAARLQEQGRDGDVVIGEATHRLVAARVTLEPLGCFALKGRAETVKAYRVVSLERPTGTATAAFVGREEELARIGAVYDAAVAKPAARLAVLLGSPGLGKSRLIDEFLRRQGDAVSVLTAHCDAAGGATFAPVAEALRGFLVVEDGAARQEALDGATAPRPSEEREALGLRAALEAALPAADADRTRIVAGISALLAGAPASPEETFFVIRRLLTGLAAAKPVVLAVDDLQWGEPLLLDLVEHLVQWGSGVPLLVLVGARPELRDLRSSLATPGGFVSEVVTLSGLDAGAAMRLAANVIGAADLPAAVAAKVLATSEGNPLFVGELVRMLVQEGALTKEGERWTTGAGLASLEMPPTIHALLAARIERLRPDERSVLERAAVVGRHFSRGAVAALLGRRGSELDARLEALRRTELIEHDTGWFLGEPVLRFHHVLIRDAAYRRLLKGTRAELHERLADWIEAQVGEAAEHDETIGWHLEQAHQHLSELGPLDGKGRSLGKRAAGRLAAAGRRALARDDVPLAASLLGRAIDRLDADAPARADLVLDWCEALLSAGDVVAAAKAIDELARFADASPPLSTAGGLGVTGLGVTKEQRVAPNPITPNPLRLRAWHTCFAAQLTVLTAPQGLQGAADTVAAAAEQLAKLDDAAGEAKAHSVHAQALARLGRVGASEAALDKALAAARKAGDRRRANAVLAGAPLAALWGPSPVTRASGRCLDVVRVLRITQGAPAVEAVALSCQGVLEALRGRTDAARRMIGTARKMVEELGIAHRLSEADVFAGRIDLLEGDAAAAERNLRGAYGGLRDRGLGIDAARAGALLARAQLAQGKVAEAEELSHESEALAGDDLQAAIAWRGVRAQALASRGETKAAVELAWAAVAIAAATDALLDHADARLALGAALRAAGRGAEADAEERRAIELWEAKGATLLAERAARTDRQSSIAFAVENGTAPTHSAEASVRFDRSRDGEARVEPGRGVRRRVRPNAASAAVAGIEAAFRARDLGAVEALCGDPLETIDHPNGASYGREGQIESSRRMMRLPNLEFRLELLATLGESLCLSRRLVSASGTAGGDFDVGEYEMEHLTITELDAVGRCGHFEGFAPDHLGDAIVRLYARYAELLPAGPERERAVATAGSIAAMVAPPDMGRYASALAPDVDFADHRTVGFAFGRGADTLLRGFGSLLELAEHVATRVDGILALEPGAVLLRWTTSGTDRAGGGAFESSFLLFWKFGDDGRVARDETFDANRVAEALARFDELVGDTAAEPAADTAAVPFANAATRSVDRVTSCFAARDWTGIVAMVDPTMRFCDRRRLIRLEAGAEEFLAGHRVLFEVPGGRWWIPPLATRGERLALHRVRFDGYVAHDGGALAYDEHLCLVEVGAHRRFLATMLFDLDDLDAAYAELDERYVSGEAAQFGAVTTGARAFAAAVAARDWEGLAAVLAPSLVVYDHRPLGWETLRGPAMLVDTFRSFVELAPDVRLRIDHISVSANGSLALATFSGTHEGGEFEDVRVVVHEYDRNGKICRHDIYNPKQLDDAWARFEKLTATPPTPARFANAATATVAPVIACMLAHDWPGFERLFAEGFHMSDRRRLVQLELDRDQYVAFTREVADKRAIRADSRVLATRGNRLALTRPTYEFTDAEVGPSEIAFLIITEVDDRGRIAAYVRFDPDDLDAAYAELEARWEAGEAAQHPLAAAWLRDFGEANSRHDWDAVAACYAPQLVGHDHRLVGWGTPRDPTAFLATLRMMAELAPDAQMRADHGRTSRRGILFVSTWMGTRDGGAFESPFISVIELDADGRALRQDVYDPHHLDAALRRFEEIARSTGSEASRPVRSAEIGARAPTDSLMALAKPTTATAAMERLWAAFDANDWDAIRAACATDFKWEDRRLLFRLSGDVELMIASARERMAAGARHERRSIQGTAGDRVAVSRVLWAGGPADGRFEVEFLVVQECDEAGRGITAIFFDPDDGRAAQREAWARWAAIDRAAAAVTAAIGEQIDAFNAHDPVKYRAVFADDLVVEDRRRTGMGRIDGADAYVASLVALWELAPASRVDAGWFWPACDRHGAITDVRRTGTLPGGGDFENEYLHLCTLARGRVTRVELFEIDDLDAALARFAELRPDPRRGRRAFRGSLHRA